LAVSAAKLAAAALAAAGWRGWDLAGAVLVDTFMNPL
jgi:hypothetical protein